MLAAVVCETVPERPSSLVSLLKPAFKRVALESAVSELPALIAGAASCCSTASAVAMTVVHA